MMAGSGQNAAPQVLVFGGTLEGRTIVERLAARGTCEVTVCSATEYGGSLLPQDPRVNSIVDRLDEAGMRALMDSKPFVCVIDATHPYAVEVSANIVAAARACNLELLRIVREDDPSGDWISVPNVASAAQRAASMAGNIMLTTGSKDLGTFTAAIPDFAERLYARILPVESSLAHALELGIPVDHIIAMQGPFSTELNVALIHDLQIAVMVTKASGTTGGFPEKVEAARACGIDLIVVHRPIDERGYALDEALVELVGRFGV